MLKYISSSFLFYFFLFSILFYQLTFAQIIIEEEVFLQENDNVESIILSMPFYGSAKVYIQPHSWGTCGEIMHGKMCYLFSAGTENRQSTCCDVPCPGGSCGSWPGGGIFEQVVTSLPEGSNIFFSISRCSESGWVPFNFWTVQSGNYIYLWGYDDRAICQSEFPVGYIKFIPTNPPQCDNGPICDDDFKVPQVKPKVVEYNNDYPLDPCSNRELLFGTVPVIGWDNRVNHDTKNVFLEDFNVEACFNLETQKWRFKVSNDYKLEPRIVQAICDNNIERKRILLVDSLDNVDPNYPCKDLVNDIVKYYKYGWYRADHYLFRKLLLAHENMHVRAYLDQINAGYDKYNKDYKDALDIFDCNSFNDQTAAEDYAKNIIRDLTYDLCYNAAIRDPVFNYPNPAERDRSEEALHKFVYPTIFEWWLEAIDNCQ